MALKDWKTRPDEQIVRGLCEMRAATIDMYRGCAPWVVYYHEQLENGELFIDTDMKKAYKFVVDEQATKIFPKLQVGDVLCVEIEFADLFKDDVYVSGYKHDVPASPTG